MSGFSDQKKIEDVTIYEEDFYSQGETAGELLRILAVRLAQEWYGINVTKVNIIMKIQQITWLPFAPAAIAGIINFRGEIMSVTDLKKILGLPDSGVTKTTRLVVIESGSCRTALLVDQIDEIITVPAGQIYPKLESIAPQRAPYIEAGCKYGSKLLGILNTEEILNRGVYADRAG